jgi:hypothetical protein
MVLVLSVDAGKYAMKLRKDAFLIIVALILVFYGAANAMLYYRYRGFHYFDTDLFLAASSVFLLLLVLVLPRSVFIMLGGEREEPGHPCNEQPL